MNKSSGGGRCRRATRPVFCQNGLCSSIWPIFGLLLIVHQTIAAPISIHDDFQFIRSQLEKYGFLRVQSPTLHEFRKALEIFQEVLGVPVSGEVDEATVEAAKKPRCTHKDIQRPVNRRHKRFSISSQSKWPHFSNDGELTLKWFISGYTTDLDKQTIKSTVKKAFNLWSTQANLKGQKKLLLKFTEASSEADSDINILWTEGEHGDSYTFDGAGGKENVLAHTFFPSYEAPLNGDIHFDDAEDWTVDPLAPDPMKRFFPYVLAHEIGHALGLHHSGKKGALMYPYYKSVPLEDVVLDIDDKCGLNWNYARSSSPHFCLFVWLMNEIIPIHNNLQQANNNNNLKSTSKPLNKRNMKIPVCYDSKPEFKKFTEKKMIKNLQFSQEEAKQFMEIVCNFLSGLHVYRANANYKANESIEAEFDGVKNEVNNFNPNMKRIVRHAEIERENNKTTIFDKEFYTEQFFDEFFSIYYGISKTVDSEEVAMVTAE